jgi:tRNA (mo5U34)-methyltransferase
VAPGAGAAVEHLAAREVRGPAMLRREMIERAEKIKWYHAIDLGHYLTKGRFNPAQAIHRYGIPDNLTGLTVLDVGAWDGWFSFECERRGAHRVVASDSYAWGFGCPIDGDGQAGFNLAHSILESAVVPLIWDPASAPQLVCERFDVVLFLGVLYHLVNPLEALQHVASLVKPGGLLIVETHIDCELDRLAFPAARFYPGSELCQDATNWWGPNTLAVLSWLKHVGMLEPAVYSKTAPVASLAESCRLVVHARAGLAQRQPAPR